MSGYQIAPAEGWHASFDTADPWGDYESPIACWLLTESGDLVGIIADRQERRTMTRTDSYVDFDQYEPPERP